MAGYKRGSGKPRKTKVVNAELLMGNIVDFETEDGWCLDLIKEFGPVERDSTLSDTYTLYVSGLYSDPQDVVDYINSFNHINRRPATRDLDIKINVDRHKYRKFRASAEYAAYRLKNVWKLNPNPKGQFKIVGVIPTERDIIFDIEGDESAWILEEIRNFGWTHGAGIHYPNRYRVHVNGYWKSFDNVCAYLFALEEFLKRSADDN